MEQDVTHFWTYRQWSCKIICFPLNTEKSISHILFYLLIAAKIVKFLYFRFITKQDALWLSDLRFSEQFCLQKSVHEGHGVCAIPITLEENNVKVNIHSRHYQVVILKRVNVMEQGWKKPCWLNMSCWSFLLIKLVFPCSSTVLLLHPPKLRGFVMQKKYFQRLFFAFAANVKRCSKDFNSANGGMWEK